MILIRNVEVRYHFEPTEAAARGVCWVCCQLRTSQLQTEAACRRVLGSLSTQNVPLANRGSLKGDVGFAIAAGDYYFCHI